MLAPSLIQRFSEMAKRLSPGEYFSNWVPRGKKTTLFTINTFLKRIRKLKSLNKQSPTETTIAKLQTLRNQLSSYLQRGHDFYLRCLRLKRYSQGNKTGKTLAQQYKRKGDQSKIPYLVNKQGRKQINPKDIADCFSSFFSILYNL